MDVLFFAIFLINSVHFLLKNLAKSAGKTPLNACGAKAYPKYDADHTCHEDEMVGDEMGCDGRGGDGVGSDRIG